MEEAAVMDQRDPDAGGNSSVVGPRLRYLISRPFPFGITVKLNDVDKQRLYHCGIIDLFICSFSKAKNAVVADRKWACLTNSPLAKYPDLSHAPKVTPSLT